LNILSLFDGMSCGKIALDRAGIQVDNYYASEIDKYAIQVSKKNYPDIIQLGDVTKWGEWDLPKIDLLIGGSPCQGFSNAGLGLNFEDPRSKLFFEYADILENYKPDYFLLENVRMKKKEWENIISCRLGVEPLKINSDRFVQQNRERLYWTNIPVDIDQLPKRPDWNNQYYQWRRTYFRENKSGVCPTLTANMGTGGHNVPLHSKNIKDKLSPEECEVLQTVPTGYTEGVSKTHRYHMLGNGWTVDVIAHIFSYLPIPVELKVMNSVLTQ
jgi:site-specific DNA-cytosine methylase